MDAEIKKWTSGCGMSLHQEPFEVIGRILPEFKNGKWTYTEEIYSNSYWKSYPEEEEKNGAFADSQERAVFFACSDRLCMGKIALRKDWNGYGWIEELCVGRSFRGNGVGTALMTKAFQWTKEQGLRGLALETQDNNVLACRFYAKCGFEIGAVNTMLYKNLGNPWSEETAVYWYFRF